MLYRIAWVCKVCGQDGTGVMERDAEVICPRFECRGPAEYTYLGDGHCPGCGELIDQGHTLDRDGRIIGCPPKKKQKVA